MMTIAVEDYNFNCTETGNYSQEASYVTFGGISVHVLKDDTLHFFRKINQEDLPHIVRDSFQANNRIVLSSGDKQKFSKELTVVNGQKKEETDLYKKVDPAEEENAEEGEEITVAYVKKEQETDLDKQSWKRRKKC